MIGGVSQPSLTDLEFAVDIQIIDSRKKSLRIIEAGHEPNIATAELFWGHPKRQDICAIWGYIRKIQPIFLHQARVKRRGRNCRQHADTCDIDARALEKVSMCIKDA